MNKKETQLQQMINQLRIRLLVMCAAAQIAIDESCAALASGNSGLAGAVIDNDSAIDELENEIDRMALALLARNQPVAGDLRFVVAALRMAIDLERIGDEAASIAERVLILQEKLPEPVMEAIGVFMEATRRLYQDAVEAFRVGDAAVALKLCRNDDEATQMEVTALQRVMDYFCPEHESGVIRSHTGMHGILICRSLNRICRRAANIAEHTYFMAEGVNIKHTPIAEPGLEDMGG